MKRVRVLTAADLHQHRWLYDELAQAVAEQWPDIVALVGDFLEGGELNKEHLSPEECAERLAALPCEVVLVAGNHDTYGFEPFAERWRQLGKPLHALHGEAIAFGPLVITGFPCSFGNDSFFLMGRDSKSMDVDEWLPAIGARHGRAMRSLWLMHEPPARTSLCPPDGFMAGLDEWREAIERFLPWVTVHGHDHVTPIKNKTPYDMIGRTVCLNPGQPHQSMKLPKPIHYCVLDFMFSGNEPSLPEKVKVTTFSNEPKVIPS